MVPPLPESSPLSIDSLEPSPGTDVAGRYELGALLQRTPLGSVFRATRTQGGQAALVLIVHPDLLADGGRQKLVDRFKSLRGLGTKRMVPAIEMADDGGYTFIAFEAIEAPTLRDLMAERRQTNEPFSLREAAQITIQILEVASQMHAVGSFPRVIRPEYFFVSARSVGPKGGNVVVDSRFLGGPLWDIVPTELIAEDEYNRSEGQYLAPELKGMEPTPTPRADVYSAGAIFYELLCGEAPVGTYQLPKSRRPDLPREVDTVTELALSVSPEDRYPSANDFQAGITRTFAASDDADDGGGISWFVWALGAALVAAVGALVWNQTRIDPYDAALELDNKLRTEIYAQHDRPDEATVREILARHPQNMRYIPGGPYISGKLNHEAVIAPDLADHAAKVEELPDYMIDVFEYPNLANKPPVHGITWSEANQACEDVGKRLCSAAEIEKACRGPENYVYGYGDFWDPMFCGNGMEDIHPSGHMSECKSNWGVYDIAGNFREWTSTERGKGRRVVMGGIPQSPARGTRCSFGTDLSEAFSEETISFRCCRDVDAPAFDPDAAPPKQPDAN